jgi:hypothetical protein
MSDELKYVSLTTFWDNKLNEAGAIIGKSNLSKEDKEFLIGYIFKESKALAEGLEQNSWAIYSIKQQIEMFQLFSPFRWNDEMKKIRDKSKEKFKDKYDPDLIGKLIKKMDPSSMWNYVAMINGSLNRLLKLFGTDKEYDIFGDIVNTKSKEEK